MLKQVRRLLDDHVDYRTAIAGATLLGTIVFWLNSAHGASLAAAAALKQATYTFFAAGLIAKNNESLACRLANPLASLSLATIVSSAIAVGLTFVVHSMRGTPEPVLSTLPTALIGPPSFMALAWRARRDRIAA